MDPPQDLDYHGKIADEYELRKIVEKLLSELWENGRLAQVSIDKIIVAGRPTT
jgi:hypothetical protein